MQDFPKYIILPNKVYELSISRTTTERAFYRDIIDFQVAAHNPLNNTDGWTTLIGLSNELSEDYPSYKQQAPLEWVLIRFLSHHVRTNSVHILSGRGGEALLTTSFRDYLGKEVADDDAEAVLRIVLLSWVRVFREKNIALGDIYASTDIPIEIIKRGLNALSFLS